MVVRELVALLGVKTDQQSIKKADNSITGVAKKMRMLFKGFLAFKGVQFVKRAFVEFVELGDQLDKLSKKTGIAAINLQKLGHAAELSGASLGDIETGIKKLQASQVDAGEGLKTYTREFDRLGVSIKNEDGTFKDTSILLAEMADGMKGLETDAERTAVAVKLLGRSGTNLIPMLKEGSEAVFEMMNEMEQLGGIIDQDMIQASADYIDNVRRMEVVTLGIKNAIAKELLPTINKNVDAFIAWWKINGSLIRQRVGNTIDFIGRVLSGVSTAVKEVVKFFTGWVKLLGPSEVNILKIGAAITLLGVLIAKGPIGKLLALATVIGLIVDDFKTWQEGGRSVTGAIVKHFNDVLQIDIVSWVKVGIKWFKIIGGVAKDVFGGLFQLNLAIWKFLITMWVGPEKAFKEFINVLDLIWKEFWTSFKEALPNAAIEIENFVVMVLGFWSNLWTSLSGWLNASDKEFMEWANNVTNAILAPIEAVNKFMNMVFGNGDKEIKLKAIADLPELNGLASGARTGIRAGAGVPTRAGAPTGTQARAGAQGGVTQSTDIKINVNAAPGMSENKVAQLVASQVKGAMNKQNRAAVKAFTPAAAGGV
jgi:hypothetical protein